MKISSGRLSILYFQLQGSLQNLNNGGKGPLNPLPGPIPLPLGQPGPQGPSGPEGPVGEYVSEHWQLPIGSVLL